MAIRELGSPAELAGAIGVVVTLVYLAAQTNRNTQSVRASILQEHVRAGAAFLRLLTKPETARIGRVGLTQPDQLETHDLSEPPRVCRRLHSLRGWSDGTQEQVFLGGPRRAVCVDWDREPRTPSDAGDLTF